MCNIEQTIITLFFWFSCVMKMEPNLVLNQIGFKFFVKMTRTKGFKNSKNWSQDHTKGSIKIKIKLKPRLKALFEINN